MKMHVKTFCIVLLMLLVPCAHVWADGQLSILGYTSSSSFWVNFPSEWQSDGAAAKHYGAIFILHRAGFTFDTAPIVIVATAYQSDSVKDAMMKDASEFRSADPDIHISDAGVLNANKGARFLVREFRSQKLQQQGYESVAYHQEGPDVVVFTLSAQSEQSLKHGTPIFDALLKSFESAKLHVTVVH